MYFNFLSFLNISNDERREWMVVVLCEERKTIRETNILIEFGIQDVSGDFDFFFVEKVVVGYISMIYFCDKVKETIYKSKYK